MADPQTQTIEGLPVGAVLRPVARSQDIEGLPAGAVLRPIERADLTKQNEVIDKMQRDANTPPSGFGGRLLQYANVPTTWAETGQDDTPKTIGGAVNEIGQRLKSELPQALLGPGVPTAYQAARNLLYEAPKTAIREGAEAGRNIAEGGPIGANIGKAASGAMEGAMQATPFIGPPIERAGEDWQRGNYSGAAGGLTGIIGGLALPKITEAGENLPEVADRAKLLGRTPEQAITGALNRGLLSKVKLDPSRVGNVLPDVAGAGPDIRGIKPDVPKEQNFLDAVKQAKKNVFGEYLKQIGAHASDTIDAGPIIADAMMQAIPEKMLFEHPEIKDEVAEVADKYRKPMTLGELERYRNEATSKQGGFFRKGSRAQYEAENSNLDTAVQNAQAQGFRNAIDTILSRHEQEGLPGSELRKNFGTLEQIRQAAEKQQQRLGARAPAPLSRLLPWAISAGDVVGGLLSGHPGAAIAGALPGVAGEVLTRLNSPDYMIRQGMRQIEPRLPSPAGPPAPPNLMPFNLDTQRLIARSLQGTGGEQDIPLRAGEHVTPENARDIPLAPPAGAIGSIPAIGTTTLQDVPFEPHQELLVTPQRGYSTGDESGVRAIRPGVTSQPVKANLGVVPATRDVFTGEEGGPREPARVIGPLSGTIARIGEPYTRGNFTAGAPPEESTLKPAAKEPLKAPAAKQEAGTGASKSEKGTQVAPKTESKPTEANAQPEKVVEKAGGKYRGTSEGHIWFDDPQTKSTLAIPEKDFSEAAVRKKIEEARKLHGDIKPHGKLPEAAKK